MSKPVIRTAAACAARLGEIGEIDRKLAEIQSALDKDVAARKAEAETAAEPLIRDREEYERQVRAYCDAHRPELTDAGARKFAEFTTGQAGWRMGQRSLEVDPIREAAIIAHFQNKKWKHLLRVKVSLDARAILKEPERIKGVKGIKILPANESFWVKPVELPLAERSAAG